MDTLVEYKRGFYIDLDYCDYASVEIGGVIILSIERDEIKIDNDELYKKALMVIVRYAKILNVKAKPKARGRIYNLYEGRLD